MSPALMYAQPLAILLGTGVVYNYIFCSTLLSATPARQDKLDDDDEEDKGRFPTSDSHCHTRECRSARRNRCRRAPGIEHSPGGWEGTKKQPKKLEDVKTTTTA